MGSLPVADYVKRFSWDREMLDPQVRMTETGFEHSRTGHVLCFHPCAVLTSYHSVLQGLLSKKHHTWLYSHRSLVQELLPDLVRRILAKTEGLDAELRSMSLAYSEKRTALTALERKRAGNLMVCGLEEVVTSAALEAAGAELVPPDSEYLASLLLVVPKAGEEAFLASYETQLDGQAVPLGGETNRDAVKGSPVVPRSARRIAEDKDGYVLYAVTILKKFEASFRQACKERRYTVRDFAFDPQAAAAAAANAAALEVEVASNLNALKAASQRFYGDAIVLWLHLKAVRLFVESVLRYGLPVNFAALLVHNYTAASAPSNGGKAGAPTASQGKKTLEGLMAGWRSASGAAGGFLDAHYGDVTSGKKGAGSSGADVVIPGVTDSAGAGGPAFPFVFTDLDVKS